MELFAWNKPSVPSLVELRVGDRSGRHVDHVDTIDIRRVVTVSNDEMSAPRSPELAVIHEYDDELACFDGRLQLTPNVLLARAGVETRSFEAVQFRNVLHMTRSASAIPFVRNHSIGRRAGKYFVHGRAV